MDRKKKKSRKKSKLGHSVNAGEEHLGDRLVGQDDSTTGSAESGNQGAPAITFGFGHSEISPKEAGHGTPAKCDVSFNELSRGSQEETGVARSLEVVVDIDGLDNGLANSTSGRDNERENGNYALAAGASEGEGEKIQAPILQVAHPVQRETPEFLHDQLTSLQGKIADPYVAEVGMQAEIDPLSRESVGLHQGMVGITGQTDQLNMENLDLSYLVGPQQATAKLDQLSAENGIFQRMVDSSQVEILRLTKENMELQSLIGIRGETERLTAALQRVEVENLELKNLQVSMQREIERLTAALQQVEVENFELKNLQVRMQGETERLTSALQRVEVENLELKNLQVTMQGETESLTAALQRVEVENLELKNLQVSMQRETERLTAALQRMEVENFELKNLQVRMQGETERLTAALQRMEVENLELKNLQVSMRQETERLTAALQRVEVENLELKNLQVSMQGESEHLRIENVELQRMAVISENEVQNLEEKCRQMIAKIMALEQGETEHLRIDNVELRRIAVISENEKQNLEEKCRQMTAKIMALEQGVQQLEREVSVKAHVKEDLASATAVHSTKRWEGWTVKDPLAIAAAVAEESRMQQLAVVQTVEKLLRENDHLINKVNDQAAVINALTLSLQHKSMADDSEAAKLKEENLEPKFGAGSIPEPDYVIAGENGHSLDETIYHKEQINVNRLDESPAVLESPTSNVVTGYSSPVVPIEFPEYITAVEQEIVPFESTSPPVEPPTSVKPEQSNPNPATRVQIIKAPFRFFSRVAGYISGQDLVKN